MMKDTKRKIEAFSFFEHTAIEKYLEMMAESGWMLEKIGNFFWHYRRIEPKKVHFKVTYYPNASEFDPEPSEGEQTFREFCEHTGWMMAASSAQMLIFYNEQENPTPIETDPCLEVETIHKAAKKTFLPSMILLLICGLLNGGMNLSHFLSDPIAWLSSTGSQVATVSMFLLVLICLVQMVSYFCWRRKALRVAEQGEFLETKSTVLFHRIILIVLLIDVAYYLLSVLASNSSGMLKMSVLIAFFWVFLLLGIVNTIKNFLKRKKVSTKKNRAITLTADFLLAFLFVGCFTYFALQAARTGLFDKDVETYECFGKTFTIRHDEIPLYVKDLLEIDTSDYMEERTDNESTFVAQYEIHQPVRFDAENWAEQSRMNYTITVVKCPWLYDFCKKALLKKQDGTAEVTHDYYKAVGSKIWGAEEAYQVMSPTWGPRNRYLICYEDRMVELECGWELTDEQMVIAGGKLRR